MTTLAPIVDALETAEDVILAVLRGIVTPAAQDTPAAWGVAEASTLGRMALPADHAEHIPWTLVAQHQDGGGAQDSRLGAAGWAGLVVVRAMSRTDANARDGHAHAAAALLTPDSPTGYHVRATFDRPIAIPTLDKVITRASQWRITIRRTA